jgi:alkylation response protein AidB-like acyl-CoA dehydrogenase
MDDLIDIDALRASVADVLAQECARETVLHHVAEQTGPLAPLWKTATDLGWTSLAIPEEFGGLGLGLDALIPLYEELGRYAAPLPFITTVLTADCIARMAPPEIKAVWLPRIAAGHMATLSAPLGTAEITLECRQDGEDIILIGQAQDLVDAREAEIIVVLARDADGVPIRILIEANDGAHLKTSKIWDHGHSLSVLHANDLRLPASRAFGARVEDEEALLTHAALALSAEATGGSEGILQQTIDYLCVREQFGKPVGSFQALKHRVADHRARTVGGRALVEAATKMAVAGDQSAASEASAAKALTCTNYAEVSRDCIQLHGGMGFTAEQACHLYFKRAYFNMHLFGDTHFHLSRATSHFTNDGVA